MESKHLLGLVLVGLGCTFTVLGFLEFKDIGWTAPDIDYSSLSSVSQHVRYMDSAKIAGFMLGGGLVSAVTGFLVAAKKTQKSITTES